MNEQSLEYLKGLLAIFTLEVKQIIWTDKSSGICPYDVIFLSYVLSLTCSSQWANPLGTIVFPDGQILYQMICSSRNLFIPFAHQTIYSSVTVCSSRRFVRPLVWKRPLRLFMQHKVYQTSKRKEKLLQVERVVLGYSRYAWLADFIFRETWIYNLVPRAFSLAWGWGGKDPGNEVAIFPFVNRPRDPLPFDPLCRVCRDVIKFSNEN